MLFNLTASNTWPSTRLIQIVKMELHQVTLSLPSFLDTSDSTPRRRCWGREAKGWPTMTKVAEKSRGWTGECESLSMTKGLIRDWRWEGCKSLETSTWSVQFHTRHLTSLPSQSRTFVCFLMNGGSVRLLMYCDVHTVHSKHSAREERRHDHQMRSTNLMTMRPALNWRRLEPERRTWDAVLAPGNPTYCKYLSATARELVQSRGGVWGGCVVNRSAVGHHLQAWQSIQNHERRTCRIDTQMKDWDTDVNDEKTVGWQVCGVEYICCTYTVCMCCWCWLKYSLTCRVCFDMYDK